MTSANPAGGVGFTAYVEASHLRDDVLRGLSANPRSISSRWLYDDRGSELFEEITRLKEYYPSRTETAILREAATPIRTFAGPHSVLVEYGAGATVKTTLLLAALDHPAEYLAIDVAANFMRSSLVRLGSEFPNLKVSSLTADFTLDFELPSGLGSAPRLGFFPGSTFGNLAEYDAIALLCRMRRQLGVYGRAIIGIDLRKGLDRLLPAYDDCDGITAAFNLNLLTRINRELGATFDLDGFSHEARWNAVECAVEMHLVSRRPQRVMVSDQEFDFWTGETIHTESSRKYDAETFSRLAALGGWRVAEMWTDADQQFAVFGLVTSSASGN